MLEKIENALKQYWGYDSFRPLQKEAMLCAGDGRDSLVVMPTGGGKSLCFQAPAVIMDGMAVVVSPLISLMKDQVDALNECGVPAARIDSSLGIDQKRMIIEEIRAGIVKLLYIAPERLVSDGFMSLLGQTKVSLVAIDEAHCVSMWGHDFRPEYRQLGELKKKFPGVTIHSYTATATDHVRQDIVRQLNLQDPEILIGSFDRPNLIYKVQRRGDIIRQVREVMDRHKNESGIIYCIRRADVDEMCLKLKSKGYNVAPYHAGLSDYDRKTSQDAFITEKVDVIVATVAFGMGIDKSNVRYVIHAGMPKSLEHYQQESGRAGRDGLEAHCCLFYSGADYGIWKFLCRDMEEKAKDIAMAKLGDMYNYCTGVSCRHDAILGYFGQNLDKDNCEACDVCRGDLDYMEDSLETAQKILSCVMRLEQRYGADYTASVLIGSRDQRILESGHDQLSTYGLLESKTKRIVRDWIEQLISQGFAVRAGEYNVIEVTQRGWEVLRGNVIPNLLAPAKKQRKLQQSSKVAADSWDGVDRDLFEELRQLRKELAGQKNLPAWLIFADTALRDMARLRPSKKEYFILVNGVGDKKNREYGDLFIKAVTDYCKSHSLATDVGLQDRGYSEPSVIASSGKINLAKRDAFAMFARGVGIEDVAKLVSRAVTTVVQYLEEYIRSENVTDPSPWVDEEVAGKIIQAAGAGDNNLLRPVYDRLEGKIPYEQIRITLACRENC